MSEFFDRISKLSPKRLALLAVEQQEKLEAAGAKAHEPIAIVGVGCRFPGAASPAAYWELLHAGRDVIREVPPDRWDINALYDSNPDAPGKMSTRWGGFLERIDEFDPNFFSISPREAVNMDPQQRLLLEVCWEALEHAGLAPSRLAGTATGVFVGLCNSDYWLRMVRAEQLTLDAYFSTGNAHSVVSGRLSYLLGLHGPSISIDTACSSSLVAVHLACQSLRAGESRLALAAGVNLICAPETTIALSKAHMMAPDGRCKTFDAAADGFVRAEGCGVVVLKRLSDATADGDRVLALIAGSAVNQDGRSSGLTAPNGPAQEAVIRDALAQARVQPEEIHYVESHGTGTSLGDPIEIRALGNVLSEGRAAANPLVVGSVKTNFGHLESAAGVAGLIKVVLALEHGEIPAHLHLQKRNPHIEWDRWPLTIPIAAQPWPRTSRRRLAGVSSFGFSGTNAHLVIAEAPAADERPPDAERPVHLFTLSARTEPALRALAAAHAQHLATHPAASLAEVCATVNSGRSHFTERLALTAGSLAQLGTDLAAVATGQTPPRLARGRASVARAPEVAFLFTGQGAQYAQMGRELYAGAPVFRQTLDECDEVLRPLLERPLLSVIHPGEGVSTPLDETAYTQPALFAIEYALAKLWRSWGLEPSVVLGHSVGEYVAACVAGVFSFEDGLKLIARRAALMQALPRGGVMAAIFAPEAPVRAALAPFAGQVSLAASNGPENTVISGADAAVTAILAGFAQRGVKSQRLVVSHAFHSPLMEPMLAEFEAFVRTLRLADPQIALVSNLTGRVAENGLLTRPEYWRRHVREPVRFADSIATVRSQSCRIFLEVGPHPTLLGMGKRCAPEADLLWLLSLRKARGDWQELLTSAAALYVHGADLDWQTFDRPYARRRVALPTYPFERSRYWIETATAMARPPATANAAASTTGHPLLGARLASPLPVFQTELGADHPAFLADHRVFGAVVVPGPVYVELALAGAAHFAGAGARTVRDLTIHEAFVLPETGRESVQLIFSTEAAGESAFQIFHAAQPAAGTNHAEVAWHLKASGRVSRARSGAGDVAATTTLALEEVRARCREEIRGGEIYQELRARGFEFGPAFTGLQEIRRRAGEALGRIALPEPLRADAARYQAHPALLDACLHLLGVAVSAALPSRRDDDEYMLTAIEQIEWSQPLGAEVWGHAVMSVTSETRPEQLGGDVMIADATGAVLATLRGVQLRRIARESLRRTLHPDRLDWFYELTWPVQPLPGSQRRRAALEALPGPAALGHSAEATLARECAGHDVAGYDRFIRALDAWSSDFIWRALEQLGGELSAGKHFTTTELEQTAGVAAQHRRLLARLLEVLVRDGALSASDGGFTVRQPVVPARLAQRRAELVRDFGDARGEFRMLERCALALAEVLRGRQDPVHLLFPDGSFADADLIYQKSPFAQIYNRAVSAALTEVVTALPAGKVLRILEIGAGTGGTTSFVLPALPAGRVEYVFSDVSPLFLARAQETFRAHPFVSFRLLDIERDPGEQGFEAHAFDLVLAANVLHATADLRRTLGHVRQLLAPQGLVCLLEGTAPSPWVDLTFGLTEGWWKFSDADLRPGYPLMPRARWLTLFGELGFTEARATLADDPDGAVFAHQTIMFARGPAALPASVAPEPAGGWVVFADTSGVGAALAEQVRARGQACRTIPLPAAGTAADALAREWPAASAANPTRVVYLWGLDAPWTPDWPASEQAVAEDLCGRTPLQLLQALAQSGNTTAARLWIATRDAQAVEATPGAGSPPQALLWGLGRGFALEHPPAWGGLIDLDAATSATEAATSLLDEILQSDGEDQVAWRGNDRHVPRLAQAPAPPPVAPKISGDAAYLITGGLGGLGLKLAHWLVERGARHLVLLGRSGLSADDPRRAAVAALEELGARIEIVALDIADRAAMAGLFARFGTEWPVLRGIVHAAVAMSGGPLATLSPETLAAMLRPKVAGTWMLHELARGMPLDFFVLFSSTTSLWGVKGLAHYAAANQFLDTFAHYRRANGLPALSVNWGTWAEMRVASEADRRQFAQAGLNAMPLAPALEVFGRLLGSDRAQLTVALVDWRVLRPVYEARGRRPMFANLGVTVSSASTPTAPAGPSPALVELRQAPVSQRRDRLIAFLRGEVARVLALDATTIIELDRGFFDLGMDSLMSVELKGRLETALGCALPSTLTFNYPNLGALTDFLLGELFATAAEEDGAVALTKPLPDAAVAPAENRDALSEDELTALLAKKLEALQ